MGVALLAVAAGTDVVMVGCGTDAAVLKEGVGVGEYSSSNGSIALPLPLSSFGTGICSDVMDELRALDALDVFDTIEFDLDRRLGMSSCAPKKGLPELFRLSWPADLLSSPKGLTISALCPSRLMISALSQRWRGDEVAGGVGMAMLRVGDIAPESTECPNGQERALCSIVPGEYMSVGIVLYERLGGRY